MKSISGKRFIKILEKHGWILMRINGSHHIFSKPGKIERISVPVHGNKTLKLGLMKHLLKVAEIPDESVDSES